MSAALPVNAAAAEHGWMQMRARLLYCVECPQYSIPLETLGYSCPSCLLPAFDEA